MSHISKIELEVKDIAVLKQACNKLGLTFVPDRTTFKWFGQPSSCAHAIQVPGADYEIGVIKKKSGYELGCDFYDRRLTQVIGPQGGKLKQSYAVEKTRLEARRKGYTVIKRKTDTGVRLHIQL